MHDVPCLRHGCDGFLRLDDDAIWRCSDCTAEFTNDEVRDWLRQEAERAEQRRMEEVDFDALMRQTPGARDHKGRGARKKRFGRRRVFRGRWWELLWGA